MIKKLLLVVLLTISIGQKLYAQSPFMFYITESGDHTDNKALAASYAVVEKLPGDSVWSVKQFNMRDIILTSGFFKDETLSVPTGKFIYYHKVDFSPDINYRANGIADTLNHIQTTGYFVDGEKSGVWTDYSFGRKTELHTYNKGRLNGLCQLYGNDGNVSLEGYYVNDHKEGEWCGLDAEGFVNFTDAYNKKGINIKHTNYLENNYRPPVMPFDLHTYLRNRTTGFRTPDHSGTLVLELKISKEGVVTEAKVTHVADTNFDELMVKAFMNSPKWKPATYKGEKVDSSYRLTLNIVDVMRPETIY
jgi:hypothetical protein